MQKTSKIVAVIIFCGILFFGLGFFMGGRKPAGITEIYQEDKNNNQAKAETEEEEQEQVNVIPASGYLDKDKILQSVSDRRDRIPDDAIVPDKEDFVMLSDFSSLRFEVDVSNLRVETGEGYGIRFQNHIQYAAYQIKDGILVVYQKLPENLRTGAINHAVIEVTLPEGVLLDQLNVLCGVGDIETDNIACKGVNVDLGVGTANLKVDTKALVFHSGVGDLVYEGNLVGDASISNGVGKTFMNIAGKTEDYSLNVTNGLGEFYLNGQKVIKNTELINQKGKHQINISGGLGDIKLQFVD